MNTPHVKEPLTTELLPCPLCERAPVVYWDHTPKWCHCENPACSFQICGMTHATWNSLPRRIRWMPIGWTPQEEGGYWFRWYPEDEPELIDVRLVCGLFYARSYERRDRVGNLTSMSVSSQWSERIPEPKEEA